MTPSSQHMVELRAAEVEAEKRRGDLLRWSVVDTGDDGSYAGGLRRGLRLAASFAGSGRFGPMGLCVHVAFPGCQRCMEDADHERGIGDETGLLELRAARYKRRLEELVHWENTYRKPSPNVEDPDFAQGVATGLAMARDYLATGVLSLDGPIGAIRDQKSPAP